MKEQQGRIFTRVWKAMKPKGRVFTTRIVCKPYKSHSQFFKRPHFHTGLEGHEAKRPHFYTGLEGHEAKRHHFYTGLEGANRLQTLSVTVSCSTLRHFLTKRPHFYTGLEGHEANRPHFYTGLEGHGPKRPHFYTGLEGHVQIMNVYIYMCVRL